MTKKLVTSLPFIRNTVYLEAETVAFLEDLSEKSSVPVAKLLRAAVNLSIYDEDELLLWAQEDSGRVSP